MDPGDPGNLKQAMERAKGQGKMEEAYRKVEMDLKKTTQQAQVDLKKLGLWSGPLEDLETLAIPGDETVERFETEMQGLNAALSGVADKTNEHQASLREIARQLAELQLTGEVPSEAELVSARERRDYGWKLLRLEWLDRQDITAEKRSYDPDHDLPDAYEKSVVVSDLVADRLRRESNRVATQAALVAEQAKLEKNLEQLEDQKTSLQEQLDQTPDGMAGTLVCRRHSPTVSQRNALLDHQARRAGPHGRNGAQPPFGSGGAGRSHCGTPG